MRIAWFTPFAGGGMAARFSGMVARELSRHADVDIWHPQAAALEATALRTIAMPRGIPVSPPMLDSYDLAVYNLGEEDDGRIAEAACAAPGIAILHGAAGMPARRAYAVLKAPAEFNPGSYAASLLELAEALLPAVPLLRCIDRMAGRLAEIRTEVGAAVVDEVARQAYALFGGEVLISRR